MSDNLFLQAYQCLSEPRIKTKIKQSRTLAESVKNGGLSLDKSRLPVLKPGRPDKPELISPKDLPKRKLSTPEGQAAMIHSFAHIEFNAINLVWDLICRFQEMPIEFYQDWARVAKEETEHFEMLSGRLTELGYQYGDLPAHNGLWQMAEDTGHDLIIRLGVVPRILEARGLDVTPDLIRRFIEINDHRTASLLETIYKEEIGHVNIGTKWFRYACKIQDKNADDEFRIIISNFMPRGTGKLNHDARIKAGFSQSELDCIG